MVSYFSIPAWKIPWTIEPGGLQSMVSQRVRHDWATGGTHIHACTHTHTHTHTYSIICVANIFSEMIFYILMFYKCALLCQKF